ncbi:hypothetical protein [Agrococcus jejuensis]|uniref:Uncharacterized protein n=1 Tax=Agrococcus jejuensis TaxID=399736 RepID=A0A1G8FUT1_9MICO|nr:hypothetical protein [Agrococcus jejuensis]SDH85902.1 hypothetical protein SAMN04489720_2626 [Agrococcus jejuensis]
MTIALLAALAAGSVVVEGCVIARCLAGLAPGGARHLTALGAGFLAGELWTIGLLGAAHGLVGPGLHALVPWITVPATVALVGWVVRDAGLWLGPRFGPGAGWRLLVAAGAAVQGCGTALVASAVALAWASGAPPPWSPEAASSPLATAVLHAVLPVALALGVALQLVWLLALRGARIPMLDWTHRERASAQRTTS